MAYFYWTYRSGTVNSKPFVGKVFLRIKWKFELTVHFKDEIILKHVTEILNEVELQINRVRMNRARPVMLSCSDDQFCYWLSSQIQIHFEMEKLICCD